MEWRAILFCSVVHLLEAIAYSDGRCWRTVFLGHFVVPIRGLLGWTDCHQPGNNENTNKPVKGLVDVDLWTRNALLFDCLQLCHAFRDIIECFTLRKKTESLVIVQHRIHIDITPCFIIDVQVGKMGNLGHWLSSPVLEISSRPRACSPSTLSSRTLSGQVPYVHSD